MCSGDHEEISVFELECKPVTGDSKTTLGAFTIASQRRFKMEQHECI